MRIYFIAFCLLVIIGCVFVQTIRSQEDEYTRNARINRRREHLRRRQRERDKRRIAKYWEKRGLTIRPLKDRK